jgi:hypothetical protein
MVAPAVVRKDWIRDRAEERGLDVLSVYRTARHQQNGEDERFLGLVFEPLADQRRSKLLLVVDVARHGGAHSE